MKRKLIDLILKYSYKFLDSKAGLYEYQYLYERFLPVILKGMNYGLSEDCYKSGELESFKYVKKHFDLKSENVIFDVGANVGEYSKIIIENSSDIPFRLYSFEPSMKTFQKLKQNLNGFNNVELINKGFGEKTSVMKLYTDDEYAGVASSLYLRNVTIYNNPDNKFEEISIIRLDDFCRENNIDHIDFLKLDVEGNEVKVLEGANKMLANDNIRYIQFEFGTCNIGSRTYFEDFYNILKDKYRFYRIVKNGIYPISNYSYIQEIFTTINFLAEHK